MHQKLRTNKETFHLLVTASCAYGALVYVYSEYSRFVPYEYRRLLDLSFFAITAVFVLTVPLGFVAATIRSFFWKDVSASGD